MLLAAALVILPLSCTKPDTPSGPVDDTQQGGTTDEGNGDNADTKTYKAGDYYKEGLAEGVIVWVDETGEHGLLISLDETRAAWSTEYYGLLDHGSGLSTSDGQYNTKIIKGLENWAENYPAFAWCDAKNPRGLSSWYLPASEEFGKALPALKQINETLKSKGCPTIADGFGDYYWTSQEMGARLATPASFYSNSDEPDMYDCDKKTEHRVRAMRKF